MLRQWFVTIPNWYSFWFSRTFQGSLSIFLAKDTESPICNKSFLGFTHRRIYCCIFLCHNVWYYSEVKKVSILVYIHIYIHTCIHTDHTEKLNWFLFNDHASSSNDLSTRSCWKLACVLVTTRQKNLFKWHFVLVIDITSIYWMI